MNGYFQEWTVNVYQKVYHVPINYYNYYIVLHISCITCILLFVISRGYTWWYEYKGSRLLHENNIYRFCLPEGKPSNIAMMMISEGSHPFPVFWKICVHLSWWNHVKSHWTVWNPVWNGSTLPSWQVIPVKQTWLSLVTPKQVLNSCKPRKYISSNVRVLVLQFTQTDRDMREKTVLFNMILCTL